MNLQQKIDAVAKLLDEGCIDRGQLRKKIEATDYELNQQLFNEGEHHIETVYRLGAARLLEMRGVVRDPKTDLFLRPETWDAGIVGESRTYLPLDILTGDRVIDIGGNIGSFAMHALSCGARRVWTYEPDPSNFLSLLANTSKNDLEVVAKRLAVVGGLEKQIEFFINEKGSNKGLHSVVAHRGRPSFMVPAISFREVLINCSDANVLKIDIEGGEYDLPLHIIPNRIKKLAIEWHLARASFRPLAEVGDAVIRALGFVPVRPLVITEKGRAYLSIYLRS